MAENDLDPVLKSLRRGFMFDPKIRATGVVKNSNGEVKPKLQSDIERDVIKERKKAEEDELKKKNSS